jgi:hypothetical protein
LHHFPFTTWRRAEGFDVVLGLDLDRRAFDGKLRDFAGLADATCSSSQEAACGYPRLQQVPPFMTIPHNACGISGVTLSEAMNWLRFDPSPATHDLGTTAKWIRRASTFTRSRAVGSLSSAFGRQAPCHPAVPCRRPDARTR